MQRPQLKHTLPLDIIATIVCSHFKVKVSDIFIKKKDKDIILVRQFFHYFCILFSNESYSKISSYNDVEFSHATAMHSFKKISSNVELYLSDKQIRDDIYAKFLNKVKPNYKEIEKASINILKDREVQIQQQLKNSRRMIKLIKYDIDKNIEELDIIYKQIECKTV